jgi:hypothetical protein
MITVFGGSMKSRAKLLLFLALLLTLENAAAQPLMQVGDTVGAGQNGFHIYGVKGSIGYSSLAAGSSLGLSAGVGGEWYSFASMPVGYSYAVPGGSFAITYTPSYVGRVRYSTNDFNQNLNLQFNRRFGLESNWYITAFADDSTFEQYIFQAPALANYVNGPGSADNLDNTLNGGHTTTTDPTQPSAVFFGTRVRSFSGNTGFSGRIASRLRLSFDAGVSEWMTKANELRINPTLVPRAQLGRVNLSIGYSLSPRTEMGFHVSAAESRSVFGRNRFGEAGIYLSRKLTEHWFASGMGGAGGTIYKTTGSAPTSYSYIAEASLGYKMRDQTFAVTYARQTGSAYGFNTRASHAFTGAWNRWNRNRTWELRAFASYQRQAGGVFDGTQVREAGAGILHNAGHRLNVSLDYTYLNWSMPAINGVSDQGAHAARLTFDWIPFLRDVPMLSTGRGIHGE